ncbi:MAG: nodulation protein NfeD [Chitinivibrionales bacterium]|nr:nodulation protein NfeD [Chitinivibrionales bacterium]
MKNFTGLVVTVVLLLLLGARFCQASDTVGTITIRGAIGPTTASFIQRAIVLAQHHNYVCLIVKLDTPGGLLNSTKEIVQSFFSSAVPIIVYVTPSGGTASSAGCFITLAASVAAMAPATSIGAAHPVTSGSPQQADTQKTSSIMNKKMENYAVSFIESIAQRRNRNVVWAKASVLESASITAEKALELKVIDCIVKDSTELLAYLDGRTVDGKVLHTRDAVVAEVPMLVWEKVFQYLWSPEILYILMLIAMFGIIGELSNPGTLFPGIAGAISLILVLFMSSVLPVNITAVVLLLLAVSLFIADIFAPTHGVLTAGAIIAFVVGSLLLFDNSDAALRLSLAMIIPATVITTLFFTFVFGAGLKAQSLPKRHGSEAMIGKTARVVKVLDAVSGTVFIEGEYWNAVSETPIAASESVEIIGVKGLILMIKPQTNKGA